jgi:hypothetical protein
MEQNVSISAELDERHSAANAAFVTRNILAYQDIFSPSLVYQQADGTVIDRGQLMRDVALQFRNLSQAKSSYFRESLVAVGDRVTETLVQTAETQATAFGILHRRRRIDRRGDYTWSKSSGVWLIERVKVLSETGFPAGWRIGWRIR